MSITSVSYQTKSEYVVKFAQNSLISNFMKIHHVVLETQFHAIY